VLVDFAALQPLACRFERKVHNRGPRVLNTPWETRMRRSRGAPLSWIAPRSNASSQFIQFSGWQQQRNHAESCQARDNHPAADPPSPLIVRSHGVIASCDAMTIHARGHICREDRGASRTDKQDAAPENPAMSCPCGYRSRCLKSRAGRHPGARQDSGTSGEGVGLGTWEEVCRELNEQGFRTRTGQRYRHRQQPVRILKSIG